MPIYEFECTKCGKKFERLVLSLDDKRPECPACNCCDVQKLMSTCRRATLKVPAGYSGGKSCAPSG